MEKSDIKKWKNEDILHLKLNFKNGQVEIKKNNGNFWNLPKLNLKKGKEHSFGLQVDCRGMKIKLIECRKI